MQRFDPSCSAIRCCWVYLSLLSTYSSYFSLRFRSSIFLAVTAKRWNFESLYRDGGWPWSWKSTLDGTWSSVPILVKFSNLLWSYVVVATQVTSVLIYIFIISKNKMCKDFETSTIWCISTHTHTSARRLFLISNHFNYNPVWFRSLWNQTNILRNSFFFLQAVSAVELSLFFLRYVTTNFTMLVSSRT